MATQDRTSWQFQHGIHLPLLFIAYLSTHTKMASSIQPGGDVDRVRKSADFSAGKAFEASECREETPPCFP
jgi:hypothetical protein